jgi:hypothetical protein
VPIYFLLLQWYVYVRSGLVPRRIFAGAMAARDQILHSKIWEVENGFKEIITKKGDIPDQRA